MGAVNFISKPRFHVSGTLAPPIFPLDSKIYFGLKLDTVRQ